MPTVADVIATAESLWPTTAAEEWDRPGLVLGSPSNSVETLYLSVDVTIAVAEDAVDRGADLIFAHHPFLLHGVTSVAANTAKGAVLAALTLADCGVYSAHTNADSADGGVSDALADAVGLVDRRPILEQSTDVGIGRVGRLRTALSLGTLARSLANELPATAGGVSVSGDYEQRIESVALCAGAGDSLLGENAVRSSDVYITSDLRHHPASEFREQSFASGSNTALIDISHWAAEWLWLRRAARQLQKRLPELQVVVGDVRTDPWDFVIVQ